MSCMRMNPPGPRLPCCGWDQPAVVIRTAVIRIEPTFNLRLHMMVPPWDYFNIGKASTIGQKVVDRCQPHPNSPQSWGGSSTHARVRISPKMSASTFFHPVTFKRITPRTVILFGPNWWLQTICRRPGLGVKHLWILKVTDYTGGRYGLRAMPCSVAGTSRPTSS